MIDSGNASLLWKEATPVIQKLPVDQKTNNMEVSEEFNKTTTQTTRPAGANESTKKLSYKNLKERMYLQGIPAIVQCRWGVIKAPNDDSSLTRSN